MKRGAKRTLAVEENGFSPAENRRAGLSEDMLMRGWPLVIACLTVLVLMGWAYLGIMIADMISVMDMTEAGPGMGLFNLFNQYAGLPEEARAGLIGALLPFVACGVAVGRG